MFLRLMSELQSDPAAWKQCQMLFRAAEVPTKTTLLREGDVADTMYIVKSGCLRLWFNDNGKDITFQFFFEDQPVSSLESFLAGEHAPKKEKRGQEIQNQAFSLFHFWYVDCIAKEHVMAKVELGPKPNGGVGDDFGWFTNLGVW